MVCNMSVEKDKALARDKDTSPTGESVRRREIACFGLESVEQTYWTQTEERVDALHRQTSDLRHTTKQLKTR